MTKNTRQRLPSVNSRLRASGCGSRSPSTATMASVSASFIIATMPGTKSRSDQSATVISTLNLAQNIRLQSCRAAPQRRGERRARRQPVNGRRNDERAEQEIAEIHQQVRGDPFGRHVERVPDQLEQQLAGKKHGERDATPETAGLPKNTRAERASSRGAESNGCCRFALHPDSPLYDGKR